MTNISKILDRYNPMTKSLFYPDKGYDVCIFKDANYDGYIVDIKYPCGEPVEGFCDVPSQREGVLMAVHAINELEEYKGGHCDSEYCKN